MKGALHALAALSALLGVAAADKPATAIDARPAITNAPKIHPRQLIGARAVIPTESGQIGINPPSDTKSIKGSIGVNTKYLTEEGSTTKWIGVDTNYITQATETYKDKAGQTQTAKITMGVGVSKNKNGGLDVLLSPKVKAKLQDIAKQVTPCASSKRRRRLQRRAGEACGLRDFVDRVGADGDLGELLESFDAEVRASIDSGYGGSVDENPGFTHEEDEGYVTDEDGFFDGGSDADPEAFVFSSEEEAAAIAAEAAGVAEGGSLFAGTSVTTASFLALIWGAIDGGAKALDQVYAVPKESIHKITKTKTKTDDDSHTSTSTSSSSCPSSTGQPPDCASDCDPKYETKQNKDKIDVPYWTCQKGKSKGCECTPTWEDIAHDTVADIQTVLGDVIKALPDAGSDKPPPDDSPKGKKPVCSFDQYSGFPYNLFVGMGETKTNIYSDFCGAVKTDDLQWLVDAAGKQIDIGSGKRSLMRRTPPEDASNYKSYSIELQYKKPDGDSSCKPDCNKAFQDLSGCGTTGGSTQPMCKTGSVDTGCGTFSFNINKTPDKGHNCNGLDSNKYVAYEEFKYVILETFCQAADKQGGPDKGTSSISRTYANGTAGGFDVRVSWDPKMNFTLDAKTCEANVWKKCVDECDADKDKNPLNWRGGGSYSVDTDDGTVYYSVTPTSDRPTPSDHKKGDCQIFHSDDKVPSTGENKWYYTLRGVGWDTWLLDIDSGDSLKGMLKSDGPGEPADFHFNYADPNSGWDWEAQWWYGSGNGNQVFYENARIKLGGTCYK